MTLSRTKANNLAEKFLTLLDQGLAEQKYQKFLEENTALIPREFLQNHGMHLDLVIRKLSLARDYTTDFFYMAKSSADWHLVLVEIEKPQSKYFKNNRGDLHADFEAALGQISRWKAWMDNPARKNGFIDGTIASLRVPAQMRSNPCHIKYVLVHGRRSEFEGNEDKKGIIRSKETNDFKILSYDSLVESLHTKGHLYVGIRKNDHYDIVSPHFVSETIFSWVDPSYLRITSALRADILLHKSTWHHRKIGGGMMLDHVLTKIEPCD